MIKKAEILKGEIKMHVVRRDGYEGAKGGGQQKEG